MMLADLERGKGKLLIRQTDMDAFEVGRNTAVSPGAVVWQNDILQLIQYAPTTEKVHAKPLLIIPPWINKYYVLDLNPKKSMVKWLVEQGHTVFMVSWVNPDERHGRRDLGELHVRRRRRPRSTRCWRRPGRRACTSPPTASAARSPGTLLAYHGQDRRQAGRLAPPSSPRSSTSRTRASCRSSSTSRRSSVIGEEMEQGFMPADRMANAFNMLRANDLIWGYVVNNYMLGKDPFPFDLLYWNADSTAMPARVHRFYLEQFYVRNAFAKGQLDGARRAGDALRHQRAGLPRGDQGGSHRAGGFGLSRRQGDDRRRRALRAVGLGAYRRGGEPAGARQVPVLDQSRHVARRRSRTG